MKIIRIALLAVVFPTILRASAEEKLPVLKVGSEVYSNVTVFKVTATDLYFNHAKGMGNAKLKGLEPDMQKKFGFDSAKGNEAEQRQAEANLKYRQELLTAKPVTNAPLAETGRDNASAGEEEAKPEGVLNDEMLKQASAFEQEITEIPVERWLTQAPNIKDKFVVVSIFGTNHIAAGFFLKTLVEVEKKFRGRVVTVCLLSESSDKVKKILPPNFSICVGVDTQQRFAKSLRLDSALNTMPQSLLINPKGHIQLGGSALIDEETVTEAIANYSK